MGRTSYGVRGIRLRGDDKVIGMIVAEPGATLITACEAGYGKRTPLEDYPIKGRGGKGVINIRTEGRNGKVVGVALAREGDDVLFITQTGMLVRTPVAEISSMGRNTQGVRLVNLKEADRLVALEIVSEQDLEKYASEDALRAAITPEPSKNGARAELDGADGRLEDDEEEIDEAVEEDELDETEVDETDDLE